MIHLILIEKRIKEYEEEMSNEEKTDKSMGHPENYSDMVRIKHWKASKINALKEQITGIEPASSAWEADVLPMNYICLNYQRISG